MNPHILHIYSSGNLTFFPPLFSAVRVFLTKGVYNTPCSMSIPRDLPRGDSFHPMFISKSLYAWFGRKSTTHIMLTLLKKFAEDYTEIFTNSLLSSYDFTMSGNEVFNGEF